MDALWPASTCKLIGAGLDDARLVEDVSRLVGDHDVPVRSISRGDGRASESVSLRRQRVLPPERLRALPKGSALLLATGCRTAMVSLVPWYEDKRTREMVAVRPGRGSDGNGEASMSDDWNGEELAVRLAELEVRVAQLSNEVADVTALMTDGPASGAATPSPRYATLDDWVREYFAPTFGRPIGGGIRGALTGGSTQRPSVAWRRSGDHGRRCTSIPPWGWPRG